ncbi:oligopeptide transport system permease protein appB [Thermococcus sp. 4557]|uniref:ABC transporter permease n=1 Tax=Thermococcus sp. (strain CGMCC 1.5172 / 4557) TaxID=1042877 RepID=UPI000219E86A|nr:ABC transporter permease [Thermococcus sp. 4557]AEK73182.1 oligopeptide transport system permease protein appB [Thermococcus sp. 4557]
MGYLKYLVFRILNAILVLLIVTFIISALFVKVAEQSNLAKMNDEMMQWDRTTGQNILRTQGQDAYEKAKAEHEQFLREKYELDLPYWQKVYNKAVRTLKLDFGTTTTPIFGTNNVSDIIKVAVPRSVLLFTTATIIVIILGIFLGVRAARHAGSVFDRGLSIFALLTYSLPMWWTGMMFLLIFAFKLGWFPLSSMFDPQLTGWEHVKDVIYKLALPVFTYVFVAFGGWAWTTRNIMIGTLQEDFIMAARAKGVPEHKIIYGHALRAAAPPIVTMIIFSLLGSLGGAIISELVFNYPGMGRLYWVALQQNETNLLIGLTYFFTVLYLAGVVLADMVYGFLDPRVKVGASANM